MHFPVSHTMQASPSGPPIVRPRTAVFPCPEEGPEGIADAGVAVSDD